MQTENNQDFKKSLQKFDTHENGYFNKIFKYNHSYKYIEKNSSDFPSTFSLRLSLMVISNKPFAIHAQTLSVVSFQNDGVLSFKSGRRKIR